MRNVDVTFITKPGCHLCDEARVELDQAIERLRNDGVPVTVNEVNMLEDEHLLQFSEDIPVVLVDGKRHSFWRVDQERFMTAVRKRASRGSIRPWGRR